MKAGALILAGAVLVAGCAGVGSASRTIAWRSTTLSGSATAATRMTSLAWFGQEVIAEDPGNSDYTGQTCPTPKMPLKPTGKGKLGNTVFVLDPGHGGSDTGSYWIETFQDGRSKVFWESAYAYAITMTLADLLRRQGATVYLTAYSETAAAAAESDHDPDEPLPVPRDATFLWNQGTVNQKPGWWQRVHMGNDVYLRLGKKKKVVYFAVHVDAMETPGWKGSHVLVKDKNNPPKIAKALGAEIQRRGLARTHRGNPKPLIDRTRDLFLFRKSINPNTVMWETALPQNPEDSWRLRNRETREELAKVALNAALRYAQM